MNETPACCLSNAFTAARIPAFASPSPIPHATKSTSLLERVKSLRGEELIDVDPTMRSARHRSSLYSFPFPGTRFGRQVHSSRNDSLMPVRAPIRAVTFDAYNTLFDFASQALPMLRSIIPDEAHHQLDEVWSTMNGVVIAVFRSFVGKRRGDFDRFMTLSDIHRECFVGVRERLLPTLDVDAATEAWNRYIAQVPLYDDAMPALRWAAERFRTAIVSDIDTWMLEQNPSFRTLPLVGHVTSEQDRSYKAMADCTMFQRAARLLGCETQHILHVGDSASDVLGAKRIGARAIWLNRNGHAPPEAMPRPDATIRTLGQLPAAIAPLIGPDS